MLLQMVPEMSTFLILVLLSQAASGEVLSVSPGQNVKLQCGPYRSSITAVELTKTDPERHVFFYRDGRPDEAAQDPSFVGRVELEGTQMKNGNLSLILKNVSKGDDGMYECRVSMGRNKRAIIETDPITIITLKVKDKGSNNGNPKDGDKIYENPKEGDYTRGYAVPGVCLGLFSVVILAGWKYKGHKSKKSDLSAADEAVGDELV